MRHVRSGVLGIAYAKQFLALSPAQDVCLKGVDFSAQPEEWAVECADAGSGPMGASSRLGPGQFTVLQDQTTEAFVIPLRKPVMRDGAGGWICDVWSFEPEIPARLYTPLTFIPGVTAEAQGDLLRISRHGMRKWMEGKEEAKAMLTLDARRMDEERLLFAYFDGEVHATTTSFPASRLCPSLLPFMKATTLSHMEWLRSTDDPEKRPMPLCKDPLHHPLNIYMMRPNILGVREAIPEEEEGEEEEEEGHVPAPVQAEVNTEKFRVRRPGGQWLDMKEWGVDEVDGLAVRENRHNIISLTSAVNNLVLDNLLAWAFPWLNNSKKVLLMQSISWKDLLDKVLNSMFNHLSPSPPGTGMSDPQSNRLDMRISMPGLACFADMLEAWYEMPEHAALLQEVKEETGLNYLELIQSMAQQWRILAKGMTRYDMRMLAFRKPGVVFLPTAYNLTGYRMKRTINVHLLSDFMLMYITFQLVRCVGVELRKMPGFEHTSGLFGIHRALNERIPGVRGRKLDEKTRDVISKTLQSLLDGLDMGTSPLTCVGAQGLAGDFHWQLAHGGGAVLKHIAPGPHGEIWTLYLPAFGKEVKLHATNAVRKVVQMDLDMEPMRMRVATQIMQTQSTQQVPSAEALHLLVSHTSRCTLRRTRLSINKEVAATKEEASIVARAAIAAMRTVSATEPDHSIVMGLRDTLMTPVIDCSQEIMERSVKRKWRTVVVRWLCGILMHTEFAPFVAAKTKNVHDIVGMGEILNTRRLAEMALNQLGCSMPLIPCRVSIPLTFDIAGSMGTYGSVTLCSSSYANLSPDPIPFASGIGKKGASDIAEEAEEAEEEEEEGLMTMGGDTQDALMWDEEEDEEAAAEAAKKAREEEQKAWSAVLTPALGHAQRALMQKMIIGEVGVVHPTTRTMTGPQGMLQQTVHNEVMWSGVWWKTTQEKGGGMVQAHV